MVDSVAKGNRLQVAARRVLEDEGYTVHTAVRSAQRRGPFWISQSTDVFNAFDLVATRMERPRSLRFIQVTTANNVSERIKKVDPVPLNTSIASVEIWGYVGGQKRLDRRYKDRKVWLARNYFQVYLKERNWEPDPADRIPLGEAGPAEVFASAVPTAEVPPRKRKPAVTA